MHGYPRWQGEYARAPRFLTVAWHEFRRGFNDQWARAALIVAFGYAVIDIGSLFSTARTNPRAHSMESLVAFLGFLRWWGLAAAAIVAGPALLDDHRKGALELYLSRSLRRIDYLAGKALAVVAMCLAATLLPALAYYGGTFLVTDTHPDGWEWAWLGILGYTLMWTVVVAGLGLGLSCIARSARAATLILFGGMLGLQILFGDGLTIGGVVRTPSILNAITRSDMLAVVAPTSLLRSQVEWLFQVAAPYTWPFWWGLVGLGGLAVLGWALVVWRHPRLKGVD